MDHGRHARTGAPSVPRRVVGALWWAAFVLVLAWLQVTFVHQAFAVPSGSMEGTIMTGDRVYAEKVSYLFRDPEPGDIVTFQDPEIPGRVLIKRCIAVGGQTVDLVDGRVVVDGVALDEPYTRASPPSRSRRRSAWRCPTPTPCPRGTCGSWGTTARTPTTRATSALSTRTRSPDAPRSCTGRSATSACWTSRPAPGIEAASRDCIG